MATESGYQIKTDGYLNALFALACCIRFIGHIVDRKRLIEGFHRHDWDGISYMQEKVDGTKSIVRPGKVV